MELIWSKCSYVQQSIHFFPGTLLANATNRQELNWQHCQYHWLLIVKSNSSIPSYCAFKDLLAQINKERTLSSLPWPNESWSILWKYVSVQFLAHLQEKKNYLDNILCHKVVSWKKFSYTTLEIIIIYHLIHFTNCCFKERVNTTPNILIN